MVRTAVDLPARWLASTKKEEPGVRCQHIERATHRRFKVIAHRYRKHAAVHLLENRVRFLDGTPRSIWLSIAGDISVAYVFVHLLPELAEGQEIFR